MQRTVIPRAAASVIILVDNIENALSSRADLPDDCEEILKKQSLLQKRKRELVSSIIGREKYRGRFVQFRFGLISGCAFKRTIKCH